MFGNITSGFPSLSFATRSAIFSESIPKFASGTSTNVLAPTTAFFTGSAWKAYDSIPVTATRNEQSLPGAITPSVSKSAAEAAY